MCHISAPTASFRTCKSRDEDNYVKNNYVKKKGNDDTVNDDDLEGYLKFVMETERHRKERDAAGVNGDVKKDSRTRCDEDIDLDLAEKADNIVVDHERLKREMSELFGADALKVHTNISHHHN